LFLGLSLALETPFLFSLSKPLAYQLDGFLCCRCFIAEGCDPMHLRLAAKPCQLAFGVVAMALLRCGDGFWFCECAVDYAKGLAVAE
jgi:hypothetical protein